MKHHRIWPTYDDPARYNVPIVEKEGIVSIPVEIVALPTRPTSEFWLARWLLGMLAFLRLAR